MENFQLSPHWSSNMLNDPKRLSFVLSRYKFVSDIAQERTSILELGCSEGIGAPIAAKNIDKYLGVDFDKDAIQSAQDNFSQKRKYEFKEEDFLEKQYGSFDVVFSLDVIEHIYQDSEHLFFETVANNVSPQGIAIVGTPNITSTPYASELSQKGHVNMFSMERLVESMKKNFHNVFAFGMNDEVVHTGFAPMCHYLMAVGFNKRGS